MGEPPRVPLLPAPARKYPGPALAAVSDVWKAFETGRGNFATALHAEHRKHGNVVRIGPNEVSVCNPDDAKKLYGHGSKWLKGPFYRPWSIIDLNHFSHRDHAAHGNGRRSVASAYSTANLVPLECFCDENTVKLERLMNAAAESGTALDIAELIEWYSYDTVFSISFELLDNGKDITGLLPVLARGTAVVVLNACFSNWSWLLVTSVAQWFVTNVLRDNGPAVFVRLSFDMVHQRMRLQKEDPVTFAETRDLLTHFINAKDDKKQPFTVRQVANEALVLVVAGADTTKTSMVAFLRLVFDPANVASLDRLRLEIAEASESGQLDFPISHRQASKLEYLQACIKESMRLHPAVGMPLQRVAPDGGDVIGGQFYEAGTLVSMSAYEVHFDERAYGTDAAEWRPERWLDGDRVVLERFNLATLVHKYDLAFATPSEPLKCNESWFTPQHDFFCNITQRAID